MPNKNDVRTTVDKYDGSQWVQEGQIIVPASIIAIEPTPNPVQPTTEPWQSYPDGAVYVEGDSFMQYGKPITIQAYFNEVKYPTIINHEVSLLNAKFLLRELAGYNPVTREFDLPMTKLEGLLQETKDLNFNAIKLIIGNAFFDSAGWLAYDHVKWAKVPSTTAFDCLERIIKKCAEYKIICHLWWWGDGDSHWTPNSGVGGSRELKVRNMFVDRLKHLGWHTSSMGWDLYEWIDVATCGQWAKDLTDGMGYNYPCGARGLNAGTYDSKSLDPVELTSEFPIFFEERFYLNRVIDGGEPWTTERVKEYRDFARANNYSAIYGIASWHTPNISEYPNKEILMS